MSSVTSASGLSLANIRKTFGGTVAVDGATFSVGAGEILAVTGASGAGSFDESDSSSDTHASPSALPLVSMIFA